MQSILEHSNIWTRINKSMFYQKVVLNKTYVLHAGGVYTVF